MSTRYRGRQDFLTTAPTADNPSPYQTASMAEDPLPRPPAHRNVLPSLDARIQDHQAQKNKCSALCTDQVEPDLTNCNTDESIPAEEEFGRIEDENFKNFVMKTPGAFQGSFKILEEFEREFGKGLDSVTDPDFTKSIRDLNFQELQQKFKLSFNEATNAAKDSKESTRKVYGQLLMENLDGTTRIEDVDEMEESTATIDNDYNIRQAGFTPFRPFQKAARLMSSMKINRKRLFASVDKEGKKEEDDKDVQETVIDVNFRSEKQEYHGSSEPKVKHGFADSANGNPLRPSRSQMVLHDRATSVFRTSASSILRTSSRILPGYAPPVFEVGALIGASAALCAALALVSIRDLVNPKMEIRIRANPDTSGNTYQTLYYYPYAHQSYPYDLHDDRQYIFFKTIEWLINLKNLTMPIVAFIYHHIAFSLLNVIIITLTFTAIFYRTIYRPSFESVYDGRPISHFRSSYTLFLQPLISTAQDVHNRTSYPVLIKNIVLGIICLVAFAFILLTHPIKEAVEAIMGVWDKTGEKGRWIMTMISLLVLWQMLKQMGRELVVDKWERATEYCLTYARGRSSKLL